IVYLATFCFLILICSVLFKKTWSLYNENQFPMTIIIAAPASLCLNGYLLTTTHVTLGYTVTMLIISQFIFLFSLTFIPKLNELNFRFSFLALSFPCVTTATSHFHSLEFVNLPHHIHAVWYVLMLLAVLVAVIAVLS